MRSLLPIIAAAIMPGLLHAQTGNDAYTAGDGDTSAVGASGGPAENWMSHTRFGMFIHFGLYSIPAGVWKDEEMGRNRYAEWIRCHWGVPRSYKGIPKEDYDTLLARFDPRGFDADQWIGLAAAAGMKYFVITAKHHDGFALWDSKVSAYDIAATPFGADGRDPLGELAAACRKHGVKLGFYYSHWQDWEHPGGAVCPGPQYQQPGDDAFSKYWNDKCLPQVAELLDRYHPDMLWFDTWGQAASKQITPARRDQLIALIRAKEPKCKINGRIAAHAPAGADFVSMGDNQFPAEGKAPKVPWETPATMNSSWGYHRLDFSWKSYDTILDALITNAHHGGAITLNVGPMKNGMFQQAATMRLKQIAAWMDVNQSALHDTLRSPFASGDLPENVRATLGGDAAKPHFNLLFLKAPQDGGTLTVPQPLRIADGEAPPFLAQVLETREFLPVVLKDGKLTITLSNDLATLDHPVIRVGPASSMPHTYEDGDAVVPVKPGVRKR